MIWRMGTATWGHAIACKIAIKTKDKITKNRSHTEVKVFINSKIRNILLSEIYQTRLGGHVTYVRNKNNACRLFIEDSEKTLFEGKQVIIHGNYPQTPRAM